MTCCACWRSSKPDFYALPLTGNAFKASLSTLLYPCSRLYAKVCLQSKTTYKRKMAGIKEVPQQRLPYRAPNTTH